MTERLFSVTGDAVLSENTTMVEKEKKDDEEVKDVNSNESINPCQIPVTPQTSN